MNLQIDRISSLRFKQIQRNRYKNCNICRKSEMVLTWACLYRKQARIALMFFMQIELFLEGVVLMNTDELVGS